ncbi:hypothetical protein M501DRAFT_1020937 [Patellaria atrata CBS 101060]|uniref:Uncharacterized protein n=1 Tax=Patellaria atrata CBS 101060 TaxID=1346257 RepID=A0A9P4VN94_9PEZI|nr:hypothetical protein M501DRAFT_1020937 [Patellaria atrata CBS 101060]
MGKSRCDSHQSNKPTRNNTSSHSDSQASNLSNRSIGQLARQKNERRLKKRKRLKQSHEQKPRYEHKDKSHTRSPPAAIPRRHNVSKLPDASSPKVSPLTSPLVSNHPSEPPTGHPQALDKHFSQFNNVGTLELPPSATNYTMSTSATFSPTPYPPATSYVSYSSQTMHPSPVGNLSLTYGHVVLPPMYLDPQRELHSHYTVMRTQ